jgi:hypothetical protein
MGVIRELDVLGKLAWLQGEYVQAGELHFESLTLTLEDWGHQGHSRVIEPHLYKVSGRKTQSSSVAPTASCPMFRVRDLRSLHRFKNC